MNHSTILRRSKSHRAAVARNLAKQESLFVRRLHVRVPRQFVVLFRNSMYRSGAKLRHAVLDEYGQSELFQVDVPPGFEIDRSSNGFTVLKEERVRK